MKSCQWFVVSSLVFALLGCATQQQPTGARPAKVRAPPVSEFEQMITQLNLQGEQLARFKKACVARETTLNAWTESAEGRKLADLSKEISTAKAAKDNAKLESLKTESAALNAKYWTLRTEQRAQVLAVLTLPQQQQWASSILTAHVISRGLRQANLNQKQYQQTQAICVKAATDFVKAATIAKDPYLQTMGQIEPAVVQEVIATVLTAEQKAQLQPKPAAAPAPTKKPTTP